MIKIVTKNHKLRLTKSLVPTVTIVEDKVSCANNNPYLCPSSQTTLKIELILLLLDKQNDDQYQKQVMTKRS